MIRMSHHYQCGDIAETCGQAEVTPRSPFGQQQVQLEGRCMSSLQFTLTIIYCGVSSASVRSVG